MTSTDVYHLPREECLLMHNRMRWLWMESVSQRVPVMLQNTVVCQNTRRHYCCFKHGHENALISTHSGSAYYHDVNCTVQNTLWSKSVVPGFF